MPWPDESQAPARNLLPDKRLRTGRDLFCRSAPPGHVARDQRTTRRDVAIAKHPVVGPKNSPSGEEAVRSCSDAPFRCSPKKPDIPRES